MSSLHLASGFESRTKAAFEMVVIYRFAEVTKDPILQGAPPDRPHPGMR